jgi:hypothetical protein
LLQVSITRDRRKQLDQTEEKLLCTEQKFRKAFACTSDYKTLT